MNEMRSAVSGIVRGCARRFARAALPLAVALLVVPSAAPTAMSQSATPPTSPAAAAPAPAAPATVPDPVAQDPAAPAVQPAPAAAEPSVEPTAEGALPSVDRSRLPQDLSPWGMFESADHIVKGVMIGLFIASIVTWTVWLAKTLELFFARRRLRRGLRAIDGLVSLSEAGHLPQQPTGVVADQLEAAVAELRLSAHAHAGANVKERVLSRLLRIEAAAGRSMSRGTGLLATIGATAPFVGLFGTVWGIMNSFIGISKAQTTNLAVVAPGIAEALLATALGLVAAIPAVIIYNHFSRSIAGYKQLVADGTAVIMRLVSRDLDRGVTVSGVALARAAE